MTGMEAFPDIGTALRLCCDFVAAHFKRTRKRHFMWHGCNTTPAFIGLKRAQHQLNIA
jgi:hypothetical protein